MPVVSVDLAYMDYRDVGVAVLKSDGGHTHSEFIVLPLRGTPTPSALADSLTMLASEQGAAYLLIDGPQGWKDPDNGLLHSRRCERELNTPAKTGLPGTVKPANYKPFVTFSVALFERLTALGWTLFDGVTPSATGRAGGVLVESFPLAAWRALGLPLLPAKRKARASDITARLTDLCALFPLVTNSQPNHDELQALVAGLAGLALEGGAGTDIFVSGSAPFRLGGHWREGLIVNRRRPISLRVGPTTV